MQARPFPLSKLAFMAARRATEPLSGRIGKAAARSKVFRRWLVVPAARLYHFYDVKVKMRVLNLRQRNVEKTLSLDEDRAVKLGSHVLAELILVASASALALAELRRQKSVEEAKEEELSAWTLSVEERVKQVRMDVEDVADNIAELKTLLKAVQ